MTRFFVILLAGMLPLAAQADSTQEYQRAMYHMHQRMDIAYSGDVDSDFMRGMIPHHQGAVDMAQVVLAHGEDADVRRLAEWIIFIQRIEIAEMSHWLTRRGVEQAEGGAFHASAVAQFKRGMQQMHREMDIDYSGNADVDFVLGMIPHHQAAIDMAYTQLSYGLNDEASRLARGIIRSQASEIAYMCRWLQRQQLSCPPSANRLIYSETAADAAEAGQHHHHH